MQAKQAEELPEIKSTRQKVNLKYQKSYVGGDMKE